MPAEAGTFLALISIASHTKCSQRDDAQLATKSSTINLLIDVIVMMLLALGWLDNSRAAGIIF
jgi:hypothetical protein